MKTLTKSTRENFNHNLNAYLICLYSKKRRIFIKNQLDDRLVKLISQTDFLLYHSLSVDIFS